MAAKQPASKLRAAERHFLVLMRVMRGPHRKPTNSIKFRAALTPALAMGAGGITGTRLLGAADDALLFHFVAVSNAQAFIDSVYLRRYLLGE